MSEYAAWLYYKEMVQKLESNSRVWHKSIILYVMDLCVPGRDGWDTFSFLQWKMNCFVFVLLEKHISLSKTMRGILETKSSHQFAGH